MARWSLFLFDYYRALLLVGRTSSSGYSHTLQTFRNPSLGKLKACSCGCVFVGTHPAFDFPKLSHLQAFYLPPFLFPFARYALMFIGRFCFNELPESARHHFDTWFWIAKGFPFSNQFSVNFGLFKKFFYRSSKPLASFSLVLHPKLFSPPKFANQPDQAESFQVLQSVEISLSLEILERSKES